MEKLDHQLLDAQGQTKRFCEDQSEQQAYTFEVKKQELDLQFKQEFDKEKRELEHTEHQEGVAAVKQTIQDGRRIVYQEEARQRKLEREITQVGEDLA